MTDKVTILPCRYCGGAKKIQVVSSVSDHARADCFCTCIASSPVTEAENTQRIEAAKTCSDTAKATMPEWPFAKAKGH